MPSTKNKIAVVLGTAVLMTGAITYMQPPSNDAHERARNQMNQDVDNLGDSHEKELERYRHAGNAHGDAENARTLIPGEYRGAEPHIRIKVIP